MIIFKYAVTFNYLTFASWNTFTKYEENDIIANI